MTYDSNTHNRNSAIYMKILETTCIQKEGINKSIYIWGVYHNIVLFIYFVKNVHWKETMSLQPELKWN